MSALRVGFGMGKDDRGNSFTFKKKPPSKNALSQVPTLTC